MRAVGDEKKQLNTQTHLKIGAPTHAHTHTHMWKCHVRDNQPTKQAMKSGKRNARKKCNYRLMYTLRLYGSYTYAHTHIHTNGCVICDMCVSLVDNPLCIGDLYIPCMSVCLSLCLFACVYVCLCVCVYKHYLFVSVCVKETKKTIFEIKTIFLFFRLIFFFAVNLCSSFSFFGRRSSWDSCVEGGGG